MTRPEPVLNVSLVGLAAERPLGWARWAPHFLSGYWRAQEFGTPGCAALGALPPTVLMKIADG